MHVGRCIKSPIYWNQLQTTAIKDKKFTSTFCLHADRAHLRASLTTECNFQSEYLCCLCMYSTVYTVVKSTASKSLAQRTLY